MQLAEVALSESAKYSLSVAICPSKYGGTCKLTKLSPSISAALCRPGPTAQESDVQNGARFRSQEYGRCRLGFFQAVDIRAGCKSCHLVLGIKCESGA